MGFSYEIEAVGLDEAMTLLLRYPEVSNEELMIAMRESLLVIEANVKPETPVDRGRLRGSLGSEITELGNLSIVGRFGPSLKDEIYPQVMEFGGTWEKKAPPSAALEGWVRRVIRPDDADDIPRIAYLVARSIKRNGIKGRRYLQKGWQKSEDRVHEFFTRAVETITERITTGRS